MDYYPETETEAMELAYEYGEINTLTGFGVPVQRIQMEEKNGGKCQRDYHWIKCSYCFRK